jgi:hypothetical protein
MFDIEIREVYSLNQEVPEDGETPDKHRKNLITFDTRPWVFYPPTQKTTGSARGAPLLGNA